MPYHHSSSSSDAEITALTELIEKQATKPSSGLVLKTSKDEALRQLFFIEELIDDHSKRPRLFQTGFEKLTLQARYDLEAVCGSNDPAVRQHINRVAPKFALELVNLSKPDQAARILEIVSSSWSWEEETTFQQLWKSVVSALMASELNRPVCQMIRMLCRKTGLDNEWMSIEYLRNLLLMIERRTGVDIDLRVDTWWEAYEKMSKPVPSPVFTLLLCSQLKRKEFSKMERTIEAMGRFNVEINYTIWQEVLWPALRKSRRQKLWKTCIEHTMNIQSVAERLVKQFEEEDNLKECLRVMRRFGLSTGAQKRQTLPIIESKLFLYQSTINVLLRKGKFDHAIRFLDLALRDKCNGNYLHIYLRLHSFLQSQDRFTDSFIIAMQLLNISWQVSLPDQSPVLQHATFPALKAPSSFYAKLLSVLYYTRDNNIILPGSRLVLRHFISQGHSWNEAIYNRLVHLVKQLGRNAPVTRYEKYMKQLFALIKDADTDKNKAWQDFVQQFEKEGVFDDYTVRQYQKSARAYINAESMGRNIMPRNPFKEQSEMDAKDALSTEEVSSDDSNSSDGEKKVFEGDTQEITQENVILKEQSVEYAEEEKVVPRDQKVSTLLKNLNLSADLSPTAYAIRMRVFAVIRHDLNAALSVFKAMLSKGISPRVIHLEPLLEGLILTGYTKEAYEIKEKALAGLPGKKLSPVLYGALARGLGQIGSWYAVLSIANEMMDMKLRVSRRLLDLFQLAKKKIITEQKKLKLESPLQFQRLKEAQSDEDQVEQMKLPNLMKESFDLESVYRRFGYFQYRQQFLMAQESVAVALEHGLVADHRLRKALDRSENLLKKKIVHFEEIKSSRHLEYLQVAMNLCKENRVKVKAAPIDLDNLNKFHNLESDRRKQMVDLLKDALIEGIIHEGVKGCKTSRRQEKKGGSNGK